MTRQDLINQGITYLFVRMPVPCCDFDICGLPQELEKSTAYNEYDEKLSIKINLIEKRIEDWKKTYNCGAVDIFVKAVDCGEYLLCDNNGKTIYSLHGYVPKILDFGGDSFGDYISLYVDEDGNIDWTDVEFDMEEDRWQEGEYIEEE